MWITCWSCGAEVWVESQRECRHCYAVTRRCADCLAYQASDSTCTVLGVPIPSREAQEPSHLTVSYSCQSYTPSDEALSRPKNAPAPAPTPPPQPEPTPAPAPAPAAPRSLDEVEVVTIPREPPLRLPQHALALAHRGAAAAAPENTLAAFAAALEEGAHGIEFDVQITRDGSLVAIHDSTLDRTTSGTGPVVAMDLADIKELDAGNWFAPEFAGEKVPTLDQALEAIPAPTVLVIHLRAHENETDRCERELAEAVGRHDALKRTIICHHTRHGLHRLRELAPRARLCWIPGVESGVEYIDDAYYMGFRIVQPTRREVTEEFMAYAREKGMWVNVFWADEPADMAALMDLGVQGIITNFPERMREMLKHRA